jgi:hypothetical protein
MYKVQYIQSKSALHVTIPVYFVLSVVLADVVALVSDVVSTHARCGL